MRPERLAEIRAMFAQYGDVGYSEVSELLAAVERGHLAARTSEWLVTELRGQRDSWRQIAEAMGRDGGPEF